MKHLILGAALSLAAVAGNATTVSGIIEEGGPSGYYGPDADFTFDDFGNGVGNPLLEIDGDFTIWGSVNNVGDGSEKDGWTIDFGEVGYDLTFSWQNVSVEDGPLDFKLILKSAGGTSSGGETSAKENFGGSGSTGFSGFEAFYGLWTFKVNPVKGENDPVETMNWQLAGTAVAPVPLPAAGWMLIAGLGGLAAMRRRSKTA